MKVSSITPLNKNKIRLENHSTAPKSTKNSESRNMKREISINKSLKSGVKKKDNDKK